MTAEAAQIDKADLVRVLTPVAIKERPKRSGDLGVHVILDTAKESAQLP
jgi:hypothetical protein